MTSASVKLAHESLAAPRTLLLRLKDETRDAHESLERDLNLLRPDMTLERYRSIVERYYSFYQPWEKTVTPLLMERLPEFAEARLKVPKLLADLAYLGSEPSKVKLCSKLPPCQRWPQILGALYVLEASTLRGQIVSRHLEQMLGLSARRGTAFFASYGLGVGSMWRSFGTTLQAQTPVGSEDLVIAAAQETFASLRRCLC